jgi:hypothetical protein
MSALVREDRKVLAVVIIVVIMIYIMVRLLQNLISAMSFLACRKL